MSQSDTFIMVSGDDKIVRQGKGNDSHTEENDEDSITGIGTDAAGNGIVNSDTIDTGNGKDSITGIGTGDGNGIVNSGEIDTGNGKDSITGEGDEQGKGAGIINFGKIDTGNGKDSIIGIGFVGIFNDGTIDTGRGKDIVDALNGGFDGNGSVFLGKGDDILSGFGTGQFYGGKGTDMLILPLENYSVDSATIGNKTFVTFTLGDFTMNVTGFEVLQIGDNTYDFDNLPSVFS